MRARRPIFLFTDFGWSGPYVGQLKAAILAVDPSARIVDLMHDAPAMRPDLAAYLLPFCCRPLPPDAVVVAVVDPGVGGERAPLIVEDGTFTFVGPDNGLLARLPAIVRAARIDWRPVQLSASFHGRDLFAPVAARLAAGEAVASSPVAADRLIGVDWPAELAQIVHVDGFGNLVTGIDASHVTATRRVVVDGLPIAHARTFCCVGSGELFWHANSQGLIEVSANGVSAARILSLAPGDEILLD